MKIRTAVLAAAIIAVSVLLAPFYGPRIHASAASATVEDLDRDIRSVAAAYALIERNFADPVSSERAFYQGAIPGMLHTLDPHSNFVDPAEYRDMQRKQHAQYFGVGMLITMDGPKVVVMEPFPGSPAANADLRRGDVIVAINGEDCTSLSSGDVAEKLRGPRGTQIRVSVMRDGATGPFTATVTRGEIETTVVDAFWVKPGIAYLGVTTFEAQNVGRTVESLMRKLGEDNVKGLVLDLRNNLGGLVTEAVALAGRFLHNNQIVVSHHGRAETEQVFRAKANPLAQKYPLVVLVNRRSASASEIVSGALQDHDRAWIMGETTFGKGLVQAQFPLSEGAALLLTIAHYYTPSGRLIQRDYAHQSFYQYYTGHKGDQSAESRDVKATDAGRKMYGGGGITPDEKYATPALSIFQRRLVPFEGSPDAFYRFAGVYFGPDKPRLAEGWTPTDDVMARFRLYLKDKQMPFTDEEFDANRAWIGERLRYEFYFRAFGRSTADRARWAQDPEVLQAVESMPKAQNLLGLAQKAYAMRN